MQIYLIGVVIALNLIVFGLIKKPDILTKHKKRDMYIGTVILALTSWIFVAYAVYNGVAVCIRKRKK